MGSTFSDDWDSELPCSGKAITVRVQCSHNGQGLCFHEHRGHQVTSEWTASQLHEAIELLTGVHRQCQRLMFAGKAMDRDCTLQSIIGCERESLPDRIKLFLLVDRHRFPQRLGPFATIRVPLKPQDFNLPEMTEEFRRCGFYWDMDAGIMEGHGLQSRTPHIVGQVSPMHPVTVEPAFREAACVPKEARDFVWSYPVAGWAGVESDAYSLDTWEHGLDGGAAIKSFFSIGGYIYFDADTRVVGVTTIGHLPAGEAGSLRFAEPRRWLPEWTAALVEQGRFQRITMKRLQGLGARMCLWLRPHEVIEAADGNPLPIQPEVPHGGFVYLFHEDVLSANESELALDRYFAVVPGPSPSAAPQSPVRGAPATLFRPFTLVDGDPFPTEFVHGRAAGAPEEEGSDEERAEAGTLVMSTLSSHASATTSPETWMMSPR